LSFNSIIIGYYYNYLKKKKKKRDGKRDGGIGGKVSFLYVFK